jgi:hypothetical protein
MGAYPRLRQKLLGGLLMGVIAYVFCTVAGIGARQEVPFEVAFALIAGVLVTPGRRDRPGANKRLIAVVLAWLGLLALYFVLVLQFSD